MTTKRKSGPNNASNRSSAAVPAAPGKKTTAAPDLSDRIAQFELWLVRNWRKLAVVAGIALAGLVGWSIYTYVMASREAAASEAIAAATNSAELAAAVEAHSNARAVNPARLQLALEALAAGRYDEAVAFCDQAAAHSEPGELASLPRMLAAAALEKKGDLTAAAERYAAIGADPAQNEMRQSEANYQAGRIYLDLNRFAESRDLLTASAAVANSVYQDMARALLYRMAHPVEAPAATE